MSASAKLSFPYDTRPIIFVGYSSILSVGSYHSDLAARVKLVRPCRWGHIAFDPVPRVTPVCPRVLNYHSRKYDICRQLCRHGYTAFDRKGHTTYSTYRTSTARY